MVASGGGSASSSRNVFLTRWSVETGGVRHARGLQEAEAERHPPLDGVLGLVGLGLHGRGDRAVLGRTHRQPGPVAHELDPLPWIFLDGDTWISGRARRRWGAGEPPVLVGKDSRRQTGGRVGLVRFTVGPFEDLTFIPRLEPSLRWGTLRRHLFRGTGPVVVAPNASRRIGGVFGGRSETRAPVGSYFGWMAEPMYVP